MKKLAIFFILFFGGILLVGQTKYTAGYCNNTILRISISDSIKYDSKNDYYNKELSKAKNKTVFGVLFISAGSGLVIGGITKIVKNYGRWVNGEESANGSGVVMLLFGGASLGVGIPFTVVGSVKTHQYKEAIEATKNTALLTFGATSNGVGFILQF